MAEILPGVGGRWWRWRCGNEERRVGPPLVYYYFFSDAHAHASDARLAGGRGVRRAPHARLKTLCIVRISSGGWVSSGAENSVSSPAPPLRNRRPAGRTPSARPTPRARARPTTYSLFPIIESSHIFFFFSRKAKSLFSDKRISNGHRIAAHTFLLCEYYYFIFYTCFFFFFLHRTRYLYPRVFVGRFFFPRIGFSELCCFFFFFFVL